MRVENMEDLEVKIKEMDYGLSMLKQRVVALEEEIKN